MDRVTPVVRCGAAICYYYLMNATFPRIVMNILVMAVLLAALAGCSRAGPPAPVVLKGAGGGDTSAAPKANALTRTDDDEIDSGRVILVRSGDSLFGLARRHNVPLRDLIEASGVKPPYLLRVGQRIRLPAPRTHIVVAGDTVYSVSRHYNVDMTALVRANELSPPYTILVGQRLWLPATAGDAAVTVKAQAPTGERRAPPPTPARASGRFLWPVQGKLVSGFGPQSGGLHNDGINIAVPRGVPVRAAENGVVAYSGDGLRGFGHLLLIRHADGWISAYGHNDALLVKRGDVVKRGQAIARAGSTGSVRSPQLHFELRKGTRAVDPRRYLGAA